MNDFYLSFFLFFFLFCFFSPSFYFFFYFLFRNSVFDGIKVESLFFFFFFFGRTQKMKRVTEKIVKKSFESFDALVIATENK